MTMFEAGATTWLVVLVSAAVIASGPSHLAHMTGSARKIRMIMNNAYLQLNLDGTVSGINEQTPTISLVQKVTDRILIGSGKCRKGNGRSDWHRYVSWVSRNHRNHDRRDDYRDPMRVYYNIVPPFWTSRQCLKSKVGKPSCTFPCGPILRSTILQRSSVSLGQVKIQGLTTCMYLCMDNCGIPYASREFTDECVFNEMIEPHYYNSYTSKKYSNDKRTMYLGMTRKGDARRVLVRTGTVLGQLSHYTRVLPQSVNPVESEKYSQTICRPFTGVQTPRQKCLRRTKAVKGMKRPVHPKLRKVPRRKCGEGCMLKKLLISRKRKSRLNSRPAHQIRHRKHRMAARQEDEEIDDKGDEDDEDLDEDEDVDAAANSDDSFNDQDSPLP